MFPFMLIPILSTIILFVFFGLLSTFIPIFAGPISTRGESIQMGIKIATWLSLALWFFWGLIWLSQRLFELVCYACGCT